MPRLFFPSRLARAAVTVAVTGVFIAASLPQVTRAAGESKQLQHVRGTIGYQTAQTGEDFKPVFGKFDLPDDDFAATKQKSAAVIAMPDSSLISLGENTTVKSSAFDNGTATAGPGSTITLNGGSLRFDIKRPQGGAANYKFVTNTSAVGVRGTVGLLSFVNNITTVACLSCAADSVTVTTATQTVSVLTGQIVTISAAGIVTTGVIGTVVGAFTAAGVPVSAQASAAAAGLPSGGILGGVSTGTAVTAGAAVVAGTTIGVVTTQGTPKPQATATNNGSTNGGSGQPGNVSLNGAARSPLAAKPTPSPSPSPAARVLPAPVMAPPGARFGR